VTEPVKTRPVLIIQTKQLNRIPHPSTIVCPITTNIAKDADILRVHLTKGMANLSEDCAVMIDQNRAIGNKRLLKNWEPSVTFSRCCKRKYCNFARFGIIYYLMLKCLSKHLDAE
jgi:mRNA-degrading endonuclease toxin of MazEF toxin-antitoxin module